MAPLARLSRGLSSVGKLDPGAPCHSRPDSSGWRSSGRPPSMRCQLAVSSSSPTPTPALPPPWSQSRCRTTSTVVGAPSRNAGYLGPVGRDDWRPRMIAPPPKLYRRNGYARAAPPPIAVSATRLRPTTFIPQVSGEIFEARLASMLSSPLARDVDERRAKQSKRWADDSIQRETTRFRPVKAPPLQPLGNEHEFVRVVSIATTQRSLNT